MFIKLEDRNLYLINESYDGIIVIYDNHFINQKNSTTTKTKTYEDKYKNSFNITILEDSIFCVHEINITQFDLIQNILNTALLNHETNNLQDLFLYRLIINSKNSINYEFGGLNIKVKNNFYDISIYDERNISNPITFKLQNNVTFYTNLKFERLQVNGSYIFEFRKTERIRYLQIKNETLYIYFPVNEMYKKKLFSVIDQLLANYV
ncbi:MAG: hypothetical protein QXW35_05850 [Candidatus Aenigmatarchaeota archaeon]